MFNIIIPTGELKARYYAGEFSPLQQHYTFEYIMEVVLSGSYMNQIYEPLQAKFGFTDYEDKDFQNAHAAVLMADFMAQEARDLINEAMNHQCYYGLVRFVNDGIMVGVSHVPQPNYSYDSYEDINAVVDDAPAEVQAGFTPMPDTPIGEVFFPTVVIRPEDLDREVDDLKAGITEHLDAEGLRFVQDPAKAVQWPDNLSFTGMENWSDAAAAVSTNGHVALTATVHISDPAPPIQPCQPQPLSQPSSLIWAK